MKKTIFALMALAGSVYATEVALGSYEVTFGGCNVSTVDSKIGSVTLEVEGDMTASLLSLVNSSNADIGLVTNGTAGQDAAVFTPNSNVGTGTPWTATFNFDNVNKALTSLNSITLDVVILQGTGNYHPISSTWTGGITFTTTITSSDSVTLGSYTATLTPTNGKDDGVFEVTLSPAEAEDVIDLTDVSSFNMTLALTETLNSGAFVGLKGMELTGQLVPEPTTATLSLLALAGLAARRRRK